MQNFHNAFGDNIRDAFNKAKRDRDALIERAKKASGEAKKKLEKDIEEAKKKVRIGGKAQLDFNCALNKIPLAVPRLGVLAGARVNLWGMATRMYPALISEEEAKRRNFSLENRKKALAGWEKAKKIWYNVGGCADLNALEKAIKMGYDKPVFKTKKVKERQEKENAFDGQSFSNADAGVSEALIIGGVAIITSIIGAIASSGASKNPYTDKSIDTSGMYEPPLTPEQQRELDELDEMDSTGDDTIWGISKPVFYTGVTITGVLLLWGGYKLYQHLTKK